MKAKMKTRINFLLSASLAILTLICLLTYTVLSQRDKASKLVNHTYQVKEQIEIVVSDLKKAETSQRGYLLTQNSDYLALYQDALDTRQADLNKLRSLIRDNPIQTANITRLEALLRRREALLQHELVLQKNHQFNAAQRITLSQQGNRLMDAIQQQINHMKTEENQLLAHRKSQARLANNQILLILGIAAISIFGMLITAFNLYRHLNQNLEKLVEERTTELSESQQAITDYANRLEQSNKELQQFAAIASHDLKAPLRKIAYFSDMIQKDKENHLSNESQQCLERIEHSISRMQELINDLLALSRVTSTDTPFMSVNMTDVVNEAVNNLQENLFEQQGSVEFSHLPTVIGDPTQLVQMLQNLIENGLKYHRQGIPPVVLVSSEVQQNGTCEIRVADNGIGIASEYQNRIFDIFERLHNQSIYPGTGIGLAIVKRIVERHKGQIRVESHMDKGTEFIITLPVAKTQSCKPSHQELQPLSTTHGISA